MPATDLNLLGPIVLTLLALLAGYLCILRIREFLSEKPDPKITYATRSDLEKTRSKIETLQESTRKDLERMRAEFQAEHTEFSRRFATHSNNVHGLIQKNAEHIATLLAQSQTTSQRLAELALKTDKLLERTFSH
ncbi:MAG: hypothetical protein ACFBZ8_13730 [Opitutales bacterium]